MDFSFKTLKQEYYANLAERLLSDVDFENIIATIKNDVENLAVLPSEGDLIEQDGNVKVYKDENTYAIYCDAVRIVLTDNDCENLMQVSLLGEDEKWVVSSVDTKGKPVIDITSSNTKVYTVYTTCNILIPTGRIIHDIRYTSGTWNEYVFKTASKMIDYVMSFNERNKYNKLYDKFNNVKNESTSYQQV